MKIFFKNNGLSLFFLMVAWAIFTIYVIGIPKGPLEGAGDLTGWEYSGFYLFENLSFNPFATLRLVSNQTFYPYGISAVFQSWGLERDYFYGVMRYFFGIGPWLQIYFSISFFITCLGVFLFLRSRYDRLKSTLAALMIPFLNVYGFSKYPGHFGIAICHWSLLSIVCDFLILKDIFDRKKFPVHLFLTRVLLTFLSFGQEFGYVLGLSLSSFVLSYAFILISICFITLRKSKEQNIVCFGEFIQTMIADLKQNKAKTFGLLALICIPLFFIMPVAFQIVIESQKHTLLDFGKGGWHASFFRIFMPYFPFLNPSNASPLQINFYDSIEGYGSGSPGWFLLICGVIGLFHSRRQLQPVIPFLILLILCIFYHPGTFPTLKIFPWYMYARVGTRMTLAYSTLFTLFALGINLPRWKDITRSKRLQTVAVGAILACIVMLELPAMYSAHHDNIEIKELDENFFSLIEKVKASPGEAIFDWPYCTFGGNGGGFCSDYRGTSIWALRKYHEKKILGGGYARISAKNANMYQPIGLDGLLRAQAKRCLNKEELDFLKFYYLVNDFSGMLIYEDLIPKECLPDILDSFGINVAQANTPHIGSLIYLQKTSKQRSHVNKDLGRQIVRQKARVFLENIRWLQKKFEISGAFVTKSARFILEHYLKKFEIDGINLKLIPDIEGKTDIEAFWLADNESGSKLENDKNQLYITTENIEKSFAMASLIYANKPLYFSLVHQKFQNYSMSYDFIFQGNQATYFNILNNDIFSHENLIYTHPTLDPATLEYKDIYLETDSLLRFGIDLKRVANSVVYEIHVAKKIVFSKRLHKAQKIEHLSIPLKEFRDRKVDIKFIVRPIDTNHFCHSYWIRPQIYSQKKEA